MDLWFYEKHVPGAGICLKIKNVLYSKKSKYQDIQILETVEFGRMLIIDGMVMTTEKDEFVYHEMLTHVPVFSHPKPSEVLVIGAGDGGTVRELVKHKEIKKVTMVEIDGDVIKVCKKFLPTISSQFGNKRLNLIVGDGIKYVKDKKKKFDVVLLDSSDPVGPAKGLFSKDFFKNVYNILNSDGILCAQTESPFMDRHVIRDSYRILKQIFPIVKIYYATIPTYPSGTWTFTIGSKKYDPIMNFDIKRAMASKFNTKYYNEDVHRGAFMLPQFIKELTR